MPQKQAQPRYAVIKTFLRDKVESQEWAAGMQIPSEQALTEMFSVSRMTARRAVKELTDEGVFYSYARAWFLCKSIFSYPAESRHC